MQSVTVNKFLRSITVSFGDHVHAVGMICFDLVRSLVGLLNEFHGDLILLTAPFGESSSTISSPEHPSNPLQLLVLLSSQMLVPRKLLYVLETMIEGRFQKSPFRQPGNYGFIMRIVTGNRLQVVIFC